MSTKTKFILTQSLTYASLLCSIIALFLCIQQQLKLALITALTAFILDILDGPLARKWHTTSSMGSQIDLLVDFTCFILFPIFFILQLFPNSPVIYPFFCFFALAGAFRLVRNTDEGFIHSNSKTYYRGLPSFFSHMLIVTLHIFYQQNLKSLLLPTTLIGLIILTFTMPATFLCPKPKIFYPFVIIILMISTYIFYQ